MPDMLPVRKDDTLKPTCTKKLKGEINETYRAQ